MLRRFRCVQLFLEQKRDVASPCMQACQAAERQFRRTQVKMATNLLPVRIPGRVTRQGQSLSTCSRLPQVQHSIILYVRHLVEEKMGIVVANPSFGSNNRTYAVYKYSHCTHSRVLTYCISAKVVRSSLGYFSREINPRALIARGIM